MLANNIKLRSIWIIYMLHTKIKLTTFMKKSQMSEGMISAYKAGLNYEPTRAELTEFLLDCPYDEARIHEDVLRKLK